MLKSRPRRPRVITRPNRRNRRTSTIRSAARSKNIEGGDVSFVSPETSAALSLLNAGAVRERAHRMLAIGLEDKLPNFRIHLDRMAAAVDLVLETTRKAYPSFEVPFHSRWRHFVMNGEDRWASLDRKAQWADKAARGRAAFDLAIVSVLLDAGAGPHWQYRNAETGQ